MAEQPRIAVLRLSGEVSTKARATRRRFVNVLVRNVKDALRSHGAPAEVESWHERIYAPLPEDAPEALAALARVFGVQSVSAASRVSYAGLDDLVETCARRFQGAVAGRSFAVRARHVGRGERPAFRGRELEVALGAALLPYARKVDLSHPEATVRVELHRGAAHLYDETLPGPAGLPLGSEGRAVALVSGGFDSAVAAWQMLRRGVRLDYVFCNLGGRTHELGTLRVMQVIARRWSYGYRPRLHAVDFSPVVRALQERTLPKLWQVLLKRAMLRAAERIAQVARAEAIVTGEAVGQVSSQTLTNLATISLATRLPILRPLVGANKDDIVRAAHAIGTGPLSAVVQEYCAIATGRPATAAREEDVAREEALLDAGLVEAAVLAREVIDLREVDAEDRATADLEISELPEGAVVLDLRSRRDYEAWHAPEALHLDFAEALRGFPAFAKDQEYVLYCDYGLKSAHLADEMRAVGLRAHHFRGGTRGLRAWLEKQARA